MLILELSVSSWLEMVGKVKFYLWFWLFLSQSTPSTSSIAYERRLADAKVEKWYWGYENDSFPHGFNLTDRVAIILTGQLRSANRTWTSHTLHENTNFKMFGAQDPPSTAGTIIEWLFKPLARKRGLDVFMYQTAHPGYNNSDWDGRPETYEPMIGDMRVCEVFSQNDVFNNTGNRFFCLVEPENELLNPFIAAFPTWKVYYTGNGAPHRLEEQALQQLYAMFQGNQAAKQYSIASGANYKYKIRLRPDTAFLKPFPEPDTLNFGPLHAGSVGTIYYANRHIYNNGNEDWFNIGLANHMDILFNRYLDFTSEPLLHSSHKDHFTMENFLEEMLGIRYNLALTGYDDIWMVVIRVAHHVMNTWEPPPNTNNWRDLSVMPVVKNNSSLSVAGDAKKRKRR